MKTLKELNRNYLKDKRFRTDEAICQEVHKPGYKGTFSLFPYCDDPECFCNVRWQSFRKYVLNKGAVLEKELKDLLDENRGSIYCSLFVEQANKAPNKLPEQATRNLDTMYRRLFMWAHDTTVYWGPTENKLFYDTIYADLKVLKKTRQDQEKKVLATGVVYLRERVARGDALSRSYAEDQAHMTFVDAKRQLLKTKHSIQKLKRRRQIEMPWETSVSNWMPKYTVDLQVSGRARYAAKKNRTVERAVKLFGYTPPSVETHERIADMHRTDTVRGITLGAANLQMRGRRRSRSSSRSNSRSSSSSYRESDLIGDSADTSERPSKRRRRNKKKKKTACNIL